MDRFYKVKRLLYLPYGQIMAMWASLRACDVIHSKRSAMILPLRTERILVFYPGSIKRVGIFFIKKRKLFASLSIGWSVIE